MFCSEVLVVRTKFLVGSHTPNTFNKQLAVEVAGFQTPHPKTFSHGVARV